MSLIRPDELPKKKLNAKPSRSCERKDSVEALTETMAGLTIDLTREVVGLMEAVPEMNLAVALIVVGLTMMKEVGQIQGTEGIIDENLCH